MIAGPVSNDWCPPGRGETAKHWRLLEAFLAVCKIFWQLAIGSRMARRSCEIGLGEGDSISDRMKACT